MARVKPSPTNGRKPELDLQTVVLLAQSAEDACDHCVSLALQKTCASTAVLLLYRPETDELEVVASAGQRSERAIGLRLPRGKGLAWHVMVTSCPYLLQDAHTSRDAHFLVGQPQPGIYLGVPLVAPDGQVLGVLSTDTTGSPEILDESDAQLLLLLGQATAVAYSRWKALDEARRNAWQYQQLAQLSAQLETLTEPDDIAREALEMLLTLSKFGVGAVVGVNAEGLLHLVMVRGAPEAASFVGAALSGTHEPYGLMAEIMTTDRSVVLPDYLSSKHAQSGHTQSGLTRLRSVMGAPLHHGGKVVGIIGLLNLDSACAVPPELPALLEMVAARVDRAHERTASFAQMRQMREAALRAVGRMLEERDGETFGHTDRVTTLSLRLGRALGLGDEALQHLRWGAYLHDIGKVSLGDDILRKPGPLSAAERRRMQKHVITGDQLLRDEIIVPREVRQIVRSHHERWDGAGYPDALCGTDIPLLARIFSVADVYDALVSERPYKPAWSHQQALTELRRGAGSQFDPRALAAFEELFSDDD